MEKLFSGGEIKFPDPLGVGSFLSLALTVFAEVLCSIFVLIGLRTRLTVIPLIITMLVALVIVHKGDSLGDREPALLYLLSYVTLLVFGGGKIGADHFI